MLYVFYVQKNKMRVLHVKMRWWLRQDRSYICGSPLINYLVYTIQLCGFVTVVRTVRQRILMYANFTVLVVHVFYHRK